MSHRRDLKPEEAILWNKVARTTRAYRALAEMVILPSNPQPIVGSHPRTMIHQKEPTTPRLVRKHTPAQQVPARAPASPQRLVDHNIADATGHRKIRRGQLHIDGRIDLHGFRQAEAQIELTNFLVRMRQDGARCVLVITGKGKIAQQGDNDLMPKLGVIRRRLPEWLAGPMIRQHVSGFASAHPKHGGSGAYYVLLKAYSGD
ncbi:Smr/MutS family protein [Candidatus Phycosocius spiralis]|uniref:Smr protein/Muts2-like n=1 Tax=Candidatus Phycosocius spiralis TaxID=2815099 RepID=A0ABQ4PUJ4_9PROT|nr:Smr/MutS family protein [Candidatus Phycosocius spiralis]GIU66686.1 smr protein/Muts2-like [Candidatus Phycosocius spiralis]